MDFDDDFDNHFDSDPLNFRDPTSAYLFLSDDAQDELGNSQNRKLRCLLCGHEFKGRKTDQCPICYGTQFSEIR